MSYRGRSIELSPSDDPRQCRGELHSPSVCPVLPRDPDRCLGRSVGTSLPASASSASLRACSPLICLIFCWAYWYYLHWQHPVPTNSINSLPVCKNVLLYVLRKHHRRKIFSFRFFKVPLLCSFMVGIYIDIDWLTKYNNVYEIKLSSNYLDASVFFCTTL